jgi:hypothetical protein
MAIGSTRADAPPFLDSAPLIGSTALGGIPAQALGGERTGSNRLRASESSRIIEEGAGASFCAINRYSTGTAASDVRSLHAMSSSAIRIEVELRHLLCMGARHRA